MPAPTDFRIVDVETSTQQIDYRSPIKFGGRVVRDVTVLDATVTIEAVNGQRQVGRGSMTMGNVWAWPSASLGATETLSAMLGFADRARDNIQSESITGDVLQVTHRLAELMPHWCADWQAEQGSAEAMPQLAVLVSTSPIQNAIHDAFGRLCGQSAFACLGSSWINHDLSEYLNDEFASEYLDRYTRSTPVASLPLYHLVGALDPLTPQDVKDPLEDGLPNDLGEWIKADGLTHLKIKLAGDDLDWDIERVLGIDRVAEQVQESRGVPSWFYSLDFNEKCPDIEYVLEFLSKIMERRPAGFDRVQYVEQPMHRDMSQGAGATPVFEAAQLKPVVIDESLLGFESLLRAKELGYSGVALKACKGQTESLLMAAAAQKYEMFLCVQDLTCVGASFLHSASLAAHIPTVAAIEGNGRQFCPAGNAAWVETFPSMFDIADGTVGTSALSGVGLGFDWISE